MTKFLLAFILLALAVPTMALAGNDKITICHATNSESNPYVEITVSESAAQAHLDGTHPSHHGVTTDDEDFLLEEGEECDSVPDPSATPTPTPSTSVVPTPTPTVAPSTTPTPSVEPTPTATPTPRVVTPTPRVTRPVTIPDTAMEKTTLRAVASDTREE